MANAAAAAAKDDQPTHRFAKDQLKAFVERVERLAPSCGCASRTSTSARSRKRSWRLTCTRSGCWDKTSADNRN